MSAQGAWNADKAHPRSALLARADKFESNVSSLTENSFLDFKSYMTAQRLLVTFSEPNLCLPSVWSFPFLPADILTVFPSDKLVPLSLSELLVFLVPIESIEGTRTSFIADDDPAEERGVTARDGRMLRELLRKSIEAFRMTSSTEIVSVPISAVFLASSNWVSKCLVRWWSRLFLFSETPSWQGKWIETLHESKFAVQISLNS